MEEGVQALLDAGCNAAAMNNRGQTALMIAAAKGHAVLLPRLLAGGVRLEARDEAGMTAFLHACARGQAACVGALLRPRAATRRP